MAVTAPVPKVQGPGKAPSGRASEQRTALAFIMPATILLSIFLIVPFLMALGFSFTDQRLIPNPRLSTQFIGLRNFVRLFGDETFLRALLNNLTFAVVVVPVQTAFALLLAVMVNQKLKGVNAYRALFFVPVVMPMVVVAVIWTFLYNPGEGTLKAFFSAISFGTLGPFDWLNDPKLAMASIILLSIWQGAGFQMVIYLAGLQEIPDDVYEAGAIDGANKFQEFFFITVPMLRNTTIFVVISTTILAFKLFVQVDVMTNGGPQDATVTAMLHVVNQGFRNLRVGYGSALTIAFFVIVLFISLLQQIFLKEERSVEA